MLPEEEKEEKYYQLKGHQFGGLKKNEDFKKVYSEGKSASNRYYVMYVSENGTGRNRLGISVSKKTGNSVVRHRMKRLIKESYRRNEAVFNSGLDIVVIVKKSAVGIGYAESESAILHLAKLHHIKR